MDSCYGGWIVSGIYCFIISCMKPLYIFFLFAVFIFLSILSLLYFNMNLPEWVTSYVNDFLCMPIVLTICLKAVHIIKKDKSTRLDLFTIASLTTFYSVYFEWYLPQVEPRYTADWLDVVMYFTGALVFYYLQHQKENETEKAPEPGASL